MLALYSRGLQFVLTDENPVAEQMPNTNCSDKATKAALKAAEKARAKGGLALFRCPTRPGELRLTPTTCASSHKMAQGAEDEAKVRLWECIDCPVGVQNLAALGRVKAFKQAKHAELPDQMKNLLRFIRSRGIATTNEAAAHFARHRSPVHIQLAALEVKGLVRRVDRDGALAWEIAL